MGTHPIFESDFDCLTDNEPNRCMASISLRTVLLICSVFLSVTLLSFLLLPANTDNLFSSTASDTNPNNVPCTWSGEDALRRADFCANKRLAEMFRNVCTCGNPAPITFKPRHSPILSHIQQTPLLVMAANRPKYLYRSLHSVLNAFGVVKENIIVSIDGDFNDSAAVSNLFGLRTIQTQPQGTKNARISQHYRRALNFTMNAEFKDAEYLIVLEDDLSVSPDFFVYFNWALDLFKMDPTLYCVSAWNDHGMNHAVGGDTVVNRVEGMPGLGWAMSRSILDQLLPIWLPKERQTDWDLFLRKPSIRKGRDCIIPSVSRTYHFGEVGVNVGPDMQRLYFRNHAVHKTSQVTQFAPIDNYEKVAFDAYLTQRIQHAIVIDGELSNPCDELNTQSNANFGPGQRDSNSTHVLYYHQTSADDVKNWLRIAWCLNIWDLDSRAHYHGVTFIHLKKTPMLLIGDPFSPFSQRPEHINALLVKDTIPAGLGKQRN